MIDMVKFATAVCFGTPLAVEKPMKTITVKFRSAAGSWTETSLPPWISFNALVEARREFQTHQDGKKGKLGYCARTEATSWLSYNRPDWAKRIGTSFDSLMLAYALCIEDKAVKFTETDWKTRK